MAQGDKLPLQTKIEEVWLINFDGSRKIDIFPQVFEINLFESLFSSLKKASITIYDSIGLFNNFPLIGEEFVGIKMRTGDVETRYAFVIDTVSNIKPSDDARSMIFTLRLTSVPALVDAILNVQRAYHGPASKIVPEFFKEFINDPLKNLSNSSGGLKFAFDVFSNDKVYSIEESNIEESIGDNEGTIVIPSMKPLAALEFLARRSVPKLPAESYNYMFWQSDDGFHFETLQRLMTRPVKRDFFYYSNNRIMKESEKNNAITNLVINSRIKTLSKIADGYFQNAYFEINLFKNDFDIRDTEIKDYTSHIGAGGGRDDRAGPASNNRTNTSAFEELVKFSSTTTEPSANNFYDPTTGAIRGGSSTSIAGTLEGKNRVRYRFNNRVEQDTVNPITNANEIWGNNARALAALSQIDMHITVAGDTNLYAGDIIYCSFPKFEGFNVGNGNKEDELISGRYIITDVKHLFLTAGGQHTTVLRINKDAFNVAPESVEYNYQNMTTGHKMGPR